ncbi:hypothetical protein J3F83DRAFT_625472 [Trichoderma novae-zelandiae]
MRAHDYSDRRCHAQVLHDIRHDTFTSLQYYRLDGEDGAEVDKDHTGQLMGTFAVLVEWTDDEQGRADLKDPNVPDTTLPPVLRYADNFWQEEVIKRLEEQGASISSRIYHKADTARDDQNLDLVSDEAKRLWRHNYY